MARDAKTRVGTASRVLRPRSVRSGPRAASSSLPARHPAPRRSRGPKPVHGWLGLSWGDLGQRGGAGAAHGGADSRVALNVARPRRERCSPLPEPLLATAEPVVATCTESGLAPVEPAVTRQPATVPTPDRVSPPSDVSAAKPGTPACPDETASRAGNWPGTRNSLSNPKLTQQPETHSAARNSLSSPKLVPRRVNANRRASFVRHFAHVMADKPDSGPPNRAPSGLSASPGPSRPTRQSSERRPPQP